MKNSRDLTFVILFAVLNFVFMLLVGQLAELITGIPGLGYIFIIIYSIIQTVAWLIYDGRRWRIWAQGLLLVLLAALFIRTFDPPAGMASIINFLIVDLIFNSVYDFFKRKNKLVWWSILSNLYLWVTHVLWALLFAALFFYPFELVMTNWFIPVMSFMLPVIIIEAIAGGFIGYKIYRRIEEIL